MRRNGLLLLVAAAALAAAPGASAQCVNLFPNETVGGAELRSYANKTAAECCALCTADPACHGAVLSVDTSSQPSTRDPSMRAACALKDSAERKAAPGLTALAAPPPEPHDPQCNGSVEVPFPFTPACNQTAACGRCLVCGNPICRTYVCYDQATQHCCPGDGPSITHGLSAGGRVGSYVGGAICDSSQRCMVTLDPGAGGTIGTCCDGPVSKGAMRVWQPNYQPIMSTCCKEGQTPCSNNTGNGGCCAADEVCCPGPEVPALACPGPYCYGDYYEAPLPASPLCCSKAHGICCAGPAFWVRNDTDTRQANRTLSCCDARTQVCAADGTCAGKLPSSSSSSSS